MGGRCNPNVHVWACSARDRHVWFSSASMPLCELGERRGSECIRSASNGHARASSSSHDSASDGHGWAIGPWVGDATQMPCVGVVGKRPTCVVQFGEHAIVCPFKSFTRGPSTSKPREQNSYKRHFARKLGRKKVKATCGCTRGTVGIGHAWEVSVRQSIGHVWAVARVGRQPSLMSTVRGPQPCVAGGAKHSPRVVDKK